MLLRGALGGGGGQLLTLVLLAFLALATISDGFPQDNDYEYEYEEDSEFENYELPEYVPMYYVPPRDSESGDDNAEYEYLETDYDVSTQTPPEYESGSSIGNMTNGVAQPTCSLSCKGGDQDAWRGTYQYKFTGRVEASLKDFTLWPTDDTESDVVQATNYEALIEFVINSACEEKMKVVEFTTDPQSEEQYWLAEQVKAYDLHYSTHHSRIQYICANSNEEAAATNFKRSVLKLANMQNTGFPRVDDDDECDITENFMDGHTISKSNCTSRGYFPNMPSVPLKHSRGYSNMPFVKRNQTCKFSNDTSDSNSKSTSSCSEELRISEVTTSGLKEFAFFRITSNLELIETIDDQVEKPFIKENVTLVQKSLKMDLEGAMSSLDNHMKQENQMDIEMIELSVRNFHSVEKTSERAQIFSNLVEHLSFAENNEENYEKLDQLRNRFDSQRSQSDHKEFNLFHDVIIMCQSELCSLLATNYFGGLSSPQRNAYIQYLHFHKDPTPMLLDEVMRLDRKLMERNWASYTEDILKIKFALSSMVWQRCQKHPTTCYDDTRKVVSYLSTGLEEYCESKPSSLTKNEAVQILRMLGNSGQDNAINAVPKSCYTNKRLALDVRVAAFEVNRRNGCPDYKLAMMTLEDEKEDMEVRIAAYLSQIPCAHDMPQFFWEVYSMLEEEEVAQVGSFIWTHINSLAQEAKVGVHSRKLSHLAALPQKYMHLQNKFETNPLQNSRNYRKDILYNNIGGSLDSNVIFTPSSLFPKAKLNFTFDAFDESFNLFEMGIDLRDIEKYIDSMFGAGGYMDNPVVSNMLNSLRMKRNAKIEEYNKQYQLNEASTNRDEDQQVHPFSLRIFGRDIYFNLENLIGNTLEEIQSISDNKHSTRSLMIYDQEYVTPTTLGFPLRMKMDAALTFNIDKEIEFENTKTFSIDKEIEFENIKISAKLIPHAVLQMKNKVFLEGYGSTTSVSKTTTAEAKSELIGSIDMKSTGVEIEINTPDENIFKVSVDTLYVTDKAGSKDVMANLEEEPICTPDLVNVVTGMTLCMNFDESSDETFSYHSSSYSLDKSDTHDKYIFKAGYTNDNDKIGFNFIFDTPGSSIARKFELEAYQVLSDDMALDYRASMTLLDKTFDANFKYTPVMLTYGILYNSDSLINGKFVITKDIPYSILSLSGDIYDFKYGGKFNYSKNQFKGEGNLTSVYLDHDVGFEISGNMKDSALLLEGGLKYGFYELKSEGVYKNSDDEFIIEAQSLYGTAGNLDTVQFKYESKSNEKSMLENIHSGNFIYNPYNPDTNETVNVKFIMHPNQAELSAVVNIWNSGQWEGFCRLNNINEEDEKDYKLQLSLQSLDYDIIYNTNLVYKMSPNGFQAEAGLQLSPSVHWKVSFSYLLQQEPINFMIGAQLQLGDFIIQASNKIDLSQENQFIYMLGTQVGPATSSVVMEVDFSNNAPLNSTLQAGFRYGNTHAGIFTNLKSREIWDPANNMIYGESKIFWFDWEYVVNPEIKWTPEDKSFRLKENDVSALYIQLKTEPDMMELEISGGKDHTKESKIKLSRAFDAKNDSYELYLKHKGNQLIIYNLQLQDQVESSGSFSSSLLLGQPDKQSKASVEGRYNMSDATNMGASAMVKVELPSQVDYETQISFLTTHEPSTSTRNFTISATYDNEPIEAFLQVVNHDGWFDNDHNALTFKFSSPFEQLPSFQMGVEVFGDPAFTDNFNLQWNKFKAKGLFRLSDKNDIYIDLDYTDEICLSQFKFYNKYIGPHYDTLFTFDLPGASPWTLELEYIFESSQLELKYSFETPIHDHIFSGDLRYKVDNSQIFVSTQSKYDDEKNSLLISSSYDLSYWSRNLKAQIALETSWITFEYILSFDQDAKSYVLQSNLDTEDNTVMSFMSNGNYSQYDNNFEMYTNFSSDLYNIEVSLGHKLMDNYIDQKIHTKFNSDFFIYELNFSLDETYLIPMNGTGSIEVSVWNNQFEFNISQESQNDIFKTMINEDWNGQTHGAIHTLTYHTPSDWNSSFILYSPNIENAKLESEINMKEDDLETTFDLTVSSQWTDDFSLNVVSKDNSSKQEYDILAIYGNDVITNSTFSYNTLLELNHMELSLDADVFGGYSVSLVWKHNFKYSQFISHEIRFGNVFEYKILHDLRFYSDFFGFRHFEFYKLRTAFDLLDSDYNYKADILIDEEYLANFELNMEDFKFDINGSHLKGINVTFNEYIAELTYAESNTTIPNFDFILTESNNHLLKVFIEFHSLYPEFVSSSKICFMDQEANVDINFYRMEKSFLNMNGSLRINSTLDIPPIHLNAVKNIAIAPVKFFEFFFETNNDCLQSNCKSEFISSIQVNEWKMVTELDGELEYMNDIMFKAKTRLTFEENVGFPEIHVKNDYILHATVGHTKEKIIFEVNHKSNLNAKEIFNMRYSALVDFRTQELKIVFGWFEFSARYAENELTMKGIRKSDNESDFIIIDGKIIWKQGRIKKQYLINFESDYPELKKVSGSLSWQEKHGTAVDLKIRVNKDKFHANIRHTSMKNGYDGKITAKLKNDFYIPFEITLGLESKFKDNEFTTLLNVKKNNEDNWISGNLTLGFSPDTKFSLSIQTPFEGFEHANLIMNYERDNINGMHLSDLKFKIPQIEINFEGVVGLYPSFNNSKILLTICENCMKEKYFDFKFENGLIMENNIIEQYVLTDCYIKGFGTVFNLTAKYVDNYNDDLQNVDINLDIYSDVSIGLQSKWNTTIFDILMYSTSTQNPEDFTHHFSINFGTLMNENNEEEMVFSTDSFIKEYGPIFDIKGRYDNIHNDDKQIFNLHLGIFNATNLVLESKLNVTDFEAMMYSTNISSIYDRKELFSLNATYNSLEDGIVFSLKSYDGNVDGVFKYEIKQGLPEIEFEMTSDFHSSKHYKFKINYLEYDTIRSLEVLMVQGEFEIGFESSINTDFMGFSIYSASFLIQTPLNGYEKFEGNFELKADEKNYDLFDLSEVKMEFSTSSKNISIGISQNAIGDSINDIGLPVGTHLNIKFPNESYRIELSMFGKSFYHNSDEFLRGSLYLYNDFDRMGLNTSFEPQDKGFNFDISLDLELFNLGEFYLNLDIYDNLIDYYKFLLGKRKTKDDGYVKIEFKKYFSEGYFNFNKTICKDIQCSEMNIEIEYEYYDNDNTLTTRIVYNDWSASGEMQVGLDLENEMKYFIKCTIDTTTRNVMENISFKASINKKWNNLSMELKLPFADYLFKAKYSLSEPYVEITLQRGIDLFYIKLKLDEKPNQGVLSFIWNIPLKYISRGEVKFKYSEKKNYGYECLFQVEESLFKTEFELSKDWFEGNIQTDLTSPFFTPLKISSQWNVYERTKIANLKVSYGSKDADVLIKWGFEEVIFQIQIQTPFETAKSLGIKILETVKDKKNYGISVFLYIDEITFNADMKNSASSSEEFYTLTLDTNLDYFDIHHKTSLVISLDHEKSSFKTDFVYHNDVERIFEASILYNDSRFTDFIFDVTYRKWNIIGLRLHIGETNDASIYISLAEEHFMKFMCSIKTIRTDIEYDRLYLNSNFTSSDYSPVTLSTSVILDETNNIEFNITVDDNEYNFKGLVDFGYNEQDMSQFQHISLEWNSSETPHYPIIFEAKFSETPNDNQNMKNEFYLIFTWVDTLIMNFTGNFEATGSKKLKMVAKTPFKWFEKIEIEIEIGIDQYFDEGIYRSNYMSEICINWSDNNDIENNITLDGYMDTHKQSILVNTTFLILEKVEISHESKTYANDNDTFKIHVLSNEENWEIEIATTLYPIFGIDLRFISPWVNNGEDIKMSYLFDYDPNIQNVFNSSLVIDWSEISSSHKPMKLWMKYEQKDSYSYFDIQASLETPWKIVEKMYLNLTNEEGAVNMEINHNENLISSLYFKYPSIDDIIFDFKIDGQSLYDEYGEARLYFKYLHYVDLKKYSISMFIESPIINFKSDIKSEPDIFSVTLTGNDEITTATLDIVESNLDRSLKIAIPFFDHYYADILIDKNWSSINGTAKMYQDNPFVVTWNYQYDYPSSQAEFEIARSEKLVYYKVLFEDNYSQEKNNISIVCQMPVIDLEMLSFDLEYDINNVEEETKIKLTATSKIVGENLMFHEVLFFSSTRNNLLQGYLSMMSELLGNQYKLEYSIPLYNFILIDGKLLLSLICDDAEIGKISYEKYGAEEDYIEWKLEASYIDLAANLNINVANSESYERLIKVIFRVPSYEIDINLTSSWAVMRSTGKMFLLVLENNEAEILRISYDVKEENMNSDQYILKITYLEKSIESILSLKSVDEVNFIALSVSYPSPDNMHKLSISWPNHPYPDKTGKMYNITLESSFIPGEKAMLSVSYKLKGKMKYEIELNSEYTGHNLGVFLTFDYNKKMKQIHIKADTISSVEALKGSISLKVNWIKKLIFSVDITALKESHNVRFEINYNDSKVLFEMNSSLLPFEKLQMESTLYYIMDSFIEGILEPKDITFIMENKFGPELKKLRKLTFTYNKINCFNWEIDTSIIDHEDTEVFKFEIYSEKDSYEYSFKSELRTNVYEYYDIVYNSKSNTFDHNVKIFIPYLSGEVIRLRLLTEGYRGETNHKIDLTHGDKELLYISARTQTYSGIYWFVLDVNVYTYFEHHIRLELFDDYFTCYCYLSTRYKQIKQAQLDIKIPLTYDHSSVRIQGYLNEMGFESNFDIELENYILFNSRFKYYNSIDDIQEYKIYLENNVNDTRHSAYIQYPGQKIGFEYELSEDFFNRLLNPFARNDPVFKFIISLPFEEYELISIEQVFAEYFPLPYKSEIRFGRIGYSILYNEDDNVVDMSLNEYKIQTRFFSSLSNFWNSFTASIVPKPLIFTPLYLYIQTDEIHKIEIRQGSDLILRLFVSWENLFGIGFKFFPVFPINIAFNIESNDDIDDYELDFEWNKWQNGFAGIHYHRDYLESGNRILISAKSSDYGFNYALQSALISNNNLFSNEIMLSVDHELDNEFDRFGYNVLLKRDPGFITTEYMGNLQFIIYDKGVNWNNSIYSDFRNINAKSLLFYENYNDLNNMTISEEPTVLIFDYSDMSVFGYDNHIFDLAFSNEKIESVVLSGYLIETLNGTRIMNSSLIDQNYPENFIQFKFINYPNDNIVAEFLQPSSGFEIDFDTKEIDNDNRYIYINLCSSWNSSQELIVNTNYGSNFSIDINNNQTWHAGISLESWLPEIYIDLNLSPKEQSNSYIQRLRAGLSTPRELSVSLEHKHLDGWEEDAKVWLHLVKEITGSYLQFGIEYNPILFSQDYIDYIDYAKTTYLLEKIAMIIYHDFDSLWMDMKRVVLFNSETVNRVMVSEKEKFKLYMEVCQRFVGNAQKIGYDWYDKITSSVYQMLPTQEQYDQFYQQMENIFNELQQVYQNTLKELSDLQLYLEEMIDNILIYITETIEHYIYPVVEVVMRVTSEWYNIILETYIKPLKESLVQWLQALEEFYDATCAAVTLQIENIKQDLEKYANDVWKALVNNCWMSLHNAWQELKMNLENMNLEAMFEFLQYDNMYNTGAELFDDTKKIIDYVNNILQTGLTNLNKETAKSPLFKNLWEFVESIQNVLRQLHGLIDAMNFALESLYGDFQYTYEIGAFMNLTISSQTENVGFNYSVEIGEYLDFYIAVTNESCAFVPCNNYTYVIYLKENIYDTKLIDLAIEGNMFTTDPTKPILKIMKELGIVEISPRKGRFIYHQLLPFHWDNFLQLPQSGLLSVLFREDNSLNPTYEYTAFSYWQSPYSRTTAIASITGQHIRTFDGRNYEFLGSCSYLLVKNFDDPTSYISGKYRIDANGLIILGSITIVVNENASVRIYSDGNIEKYGDYYEYVHGPLVIHRNGEKVIDVQLHGQGYNMDMDIHFDVGSQVWIFVAKRKNFGRLNGLLGNFNNEPFDDFQDIYGKIHRDTASFVASWSHSDDEDDEPCYMANQAIQIKPQEYNYNFLKMNYDSYEAKKYSKEWSGYNECSYLFMKEESPFSICFNDVKPLPYFWNCMNDMNSPDFGAVNRTSVCNSVTSYSSHCGTKGVVIGLDKCGTVNKESSSEKGTCRAPSGEIVPHGWNERLHPSEETKESADLAIIIERASCIKQFNLKQLIAGIKKSLKQKNIKNVNYYLTIVRKTKHVLSKNPMDEDKISNAIEKIKLDGTKSDDGGVEAMIDTLKNIRWRPGVSRNMLMVSCLACEANDEISDTLDEQLQKHQVKLHLLTRVKPVSSKIFGFDNDFVYTASDYNKLQGDKSQREILEVPNEHCIRAAQETGGSIFNRDRWNTKKKVQARKFLQILSQRISSSANPPGCEICECNSKNQKDVVVTCHSCDSRAEDEMSTEAIEDNSLEKDIEEEFIEDFLGDEIFKIFREGDEIYIPPA